MCDYIRNRLHLIAGGMPLHHLIYKCISRGVQAKAIRALTFLQIGVGVAIGCAAIIHAVAFVQEDTNIHPEGRWSQLN